MLVTRIDTALSLLSAIPKISEANWRWELLKETLPILTEGGLTRATLRSGESSTVEFTDDEHKISEYTKY
jgi:hypothetical protein